MKINITFNVDDNIRKAILVDLGEGDGNKKADYKTVKWYIIHSMEYDIQEILKTHETNHTP